MINGIQHFYNQKANFCPVKKTISPSIKAPFFNKSNNFNSFLPGYGFYSNLTFGYKLKRAENSHLDYYGANMNPDGTTTFRVYSDKAKIELQVAKKDHNIKYWESISPKKEEEIGLQAFQMKKRGNVFEITPDIKFPEGSLYRFKVEDKNGNISYLKDPRSYCQPKDAMGWSSIYNQNSYIWHDKKWQEGLDNRRIKHNGDKAFWGAEDGMIISEKHIGLLGGFENAKKEIDKIAEDGICNTVHILPVGEFFGAYNQGYDEVDKFAPESSYGTPDELKSLVDYAHQKGINMILDVVPNHFGFIGAAAGQFADSVDESKNTGWGPALKFNGENGEYMRKFMADMMISWLVNYHFDGLRIDATEKLDSDASLKYFASEIRNHPETRNAVLIPEHLEKTRKLAQSLNADETEDPLETFKRAAYANLEADRLGYDVQYIYDFKNTLAALALNMQIYDCPPLIEDLATEYKQGNRFYDDISAHLSNLKANNSYIYYNMHDEFNAFGGVRPIVRILAKQLNLADEYYLTSPDGLNKEPYHKAERLLEYYLNSDFSSIQNEGISPEDFKDAYKRAQAMNRLMLAAAFMHPAQKGFSMGDETGELAPLRYFAQYDNDGIKENIDREKGYDVGESSFKKSSKLYNPIKDNDLSNGITKLSKDFAKLIKENPALKFGDYNKTDAAVLDKDSLFVHRWNNEGNDIFAVMNFAPYAKNYDLSPLFPDGNWHEILNTDDKKYGGLGEINNLDKTLSRKNSEINIAPMSLIVFKRD